MFYFADFGVRNVNDACFESHTSFFVLATIGGRYIDAESG